MRFFILIVILCPITSYSQIVIKSAGRVDNNRNDYLYDETRKVRLTPNYSYISDYEYENNGKRFYQVEFTPPPYKTVGIIDKSGKVVIPPKRDVYFIYNNKNERIYQCYSICVGAYKIGKEINGHGVRCKNNSVCNDVYVSITTVYDYKFTRINKLVGYRAPFELDSFSNTYTLVKEGAMNNITSIFNKDLILLDDLSPNYVLNDNGKWVDKNKPLEVEKSVTVKQESKINNNGSIDANQIVNGIIKAMTKKPTYGSKKCAWCNKQINGAGYVVRLNGEVKGYDRDPFINPNGQGKYCSVKCGTEAKFSDLER